MKEKVSMKKHDEMHIAIVANGSCDNLRWLQQQLKPFEVIIAADGGIHHLDRIKMIPNLHVGDFDSSPPAKTNVKRYPKEKNQSDLEIAIDHAKEMGATKISLFCSLGLRLDHLLAGLFLTARTQQPPIFIQEPTQIAFSLTHSFTFKVKKGSTLSFIPLNGIVKNITTHGLKWELKNQDLDYQKYSLSNVATEEEVSIDLQEGILFVIVQVKNNHVFLEDRI